MVNWKTTVGGIIAGTIPILQTIANAYQTHSTVNWYQIAFGFAIMGLGVVMKDFDVTGGTRSTLPKAKKDEQFGEKLG
jgi:hypothetical protein